METDMRLQSVMSIAEGFKCRLGSDKVNDLKAYYNHDLDVLDELFLPFHNHG